ncbi:hypothetical protein ABFS83_02G097000 [Erythranthe nasuta]
MERLAFLVGVIGNIISVFMFVSPGMTFVRIVKKKSTEEFESIPYICTLLSSCLWTYYGITKPESFLVATVNGFGVLVQIIFVVLFLFFAPPPKRGKTAVLVGIVNIGLLGGGITICKYIVLDEELRIDIIGLMCSALNIVMYASPLSAMKRMVRRKSVEYMPFLVSFSLFLNGGIWTFYAVLVQDWFLGVPNAIGFMLGILQLILYFIYKYLLSSKTTDCTLGGCHKEPLLQPHSTC